MVPSLTVKVPDGPIPRLASVVLAITNTVPVPVAGPLKESVGVKAVKEPDEVGAVKLDEVDELEEVPLDDVPLDDEDDEPPSRLDSVLPDEELPSLCCKAVWMAAVSAVLVRANASWLARLARPEASLVIAEPIADISESLSDNDWLWDDAWFQ